MYSSFKALTFFMAFLFSSLCFGSIKSEICEAAGIPDLIYSYNESFDIISEAYPLVKSKIYSHVPVIDFGKETDCFHKTELEYISTGERISTFITGNELCDGGLSQGWVENSKGEVIATIWDSGFASRYGKNPREFCRDLKL